MKTRTATDCRDMTPERNRARRNVQMLASYHRRMANDPAFREARARKERERWAQGEGARRNAINREKNARFKAIREANPPSPKPAVPKLEISPERAAYKRLWQQAHAAELNARRQADRKANPAKYRAWEKGFRQRRREALAGQ